MKKQLTVSGLRSIIRSVISEHQSEFNSYDAPDEEDWVQEYPEDNGRDPGPDAEICLADDIAEKFGYDALDELAAAAGYDDIAGDYSKFDKKFDFSIEDDNALFAVDRATAANFVYDERYGFWEAC